MSPQSPLDSVRQILAELDISLLRANSHAEQSALIENALKRLRLLFGKSKTLFTESVVQQINAYKALLKPPPTTGLTSVALPGTASTTAGSQSARDQASIVPNSFSVGFVLQAVDAAIRRAFPTEVWIRGEVSGYTIAKSGIHYFDLVERTAEGEQRVIPCVIWKSSWIAVRKKLLTADVALAPGQEMLFFGRVSIFDRTGAGRVQGARFAPRARCSVPVLYRRSGRPNAHPNSHRRTSSGIGPENVKPDWIARMTATTRSSSGAATAEGSCDSTTIALPNRNRRCSKA